MQKKITSITAIILCLTMILLCSSCGATETETESDNFVAAVVPVSDGIPVSEAEIISFYNNIISYIQKNDNFTAANKPGVNTSESLKADDLSVLSFNPDTGEATESDSLKALNSSAKAIKDRIISGIDTSVPVIPFGDMNASVSTVIYPYDSDNISIKSSDVKDAECNVDGSNLNITINLTNNADTIGSVFGLRDKTSVIESINKYSGEYAEVQDYDVTYVNDEENEKFCTINLSVEVEKQTDGSYACTGRITTLRYVILSDVTANILCKGSFAENGNVQVKFRLTDEKSYDFDWFNSSTWEPVSSAE